MRVDIAIIGAQKCGTSSLAHQLGQHPQISFCRLKEPHYFSRNVDWRRQLDQYHSLFRPSEGQVCGEASTSYTFRPEYVGTAHRLAEYNPRLRLIYLMRHPVKRIVSQLRHDLLRGHVGHAAPEVVLEDDRYVDRSRYAWQLQPYLDCFPRSQLLLLLFEEYVANPRATLERVLAFLDLSTATIDDIDLRPQNVSAVQGHLRRLPVVGRLRDRLARAPAPVYSALRWLVRHPGRGILYRRRAQAPRLPPAAKYELWRRIEDDLRDLEQILGRRLDDVWKPPEPCQDKPPSPVGR